MKKLNIAKLLKDCPTGMELDSTIVNELYFDEITEDNMIKCYTKHRNEFTSICNFIYFYFDGSYLDNTKAKCVIFPKGKTTWAGFQRPFKDGDVAISDRGGIHLLRTKDSSYCAYRDYWKGLDKFDKTITTNVKIVRLATKDERQKLFDVIKENGYKWNSETKTLERLIVPKFKVGDRIRHFSGIGEIKTISKITNEYCFENGGFILLSEQNNWELVPDKFDINTFKSFDKVLVRDTNNDKWRCSYFSHINNQPNQPYLFACIVANWKQCIPYKNNEHLRGTTDSCNDYYKIW